MALRILLLLLIGLGSTSAQIPHCVPCTEPFQQFDYNNACDDLRNSTGYIDEYEPPLLVSVFDIRVERSERNSSFCVPCSESFVDFEAKCDDLRRFQESERIENTKICNKDNREVLFEGRCQILLEQGTCPENYWLVINNKATGPVCEYNKCFDSTSLSVDYHGLCLNLSTGEGKSCEDNKVLVVSPDGTADCECFFEEMVKLPNTEECFDLRQNTSECAPNWVLEKSSDGNPVCVRNFCSDDKIYLHGLCWTIRTFCGVGLASSYYNIDENFIMCYPIPIGFGFPTLSNSKNAKPITECLRNPSRKDGECPIFIMREKLPFV